MIPVQRLTIHASQDNLTDEDYLDIYNEVRKQDPTDKDSYAVSLAQFITASGSQYSKAAWSKYHRGELDLNRTMRSELRRAVGLDPLPPTLHEIMDDVHPDAEVVRMGNEPVNRVILTGVTGRLSLSLNGSVTLADASAQETPITSVISTQGARRDKRHRLTVTSENYEWLQGAGVTVNEAIERLRQTS